MTTAEPTPERIERSGDADDTYGTRVAIGARTPAFEGATVGLAYVGSFDEPNFHARLQPAWVDPSTLATPASVAAVATHELGHTLGLNHLVDPAPGEGWQPIMWPSEDDTASLRQWSVGTTFPPQDALAVMASHGVAARADDHGDDPSTATPLGPVDALEGAGIISTRTDVDVFTFDAVAGQLELRVDPAVVAPNLDVRAELLDASGAVVAWSDPPGSSLPDGLAARLSTPVREGTYHLRIDGVGYTSATGGGWSDYGSLGQYTISGQVEVSPAIDSLTVSTSDVAEGGTVTVAGSFSGTGAATPTATAVWSDGVEADVVVDDAAATFSSSRTFDDDEPSGTAADLVTVTVTLGTEAGTDTVTSSPVTVRNVAPTITALDPGAAEVGTGRTVTVQGSFTDPALGVATETFLVQAAWSDGETTPVTVDGSAFSTARTFTADDLPTGATSGSTRARTLRRRRASPSATPISTPTAWTTTSTSARPRSCPTNPASSCWAPATGRRPTASSPATAPPDRRWRRPAGARPRRSSRRAGWGRATSASASAPARCDGGWRRWPEAAERSTPRPFSRQRRRPRSMVARGFDGPSGARRAVRGGSPWLCRCIRRRPRLDGSRRRARPEPPPRTAPGGPPHDRRGTMFVQIIIGPVTDKERFVREGARWQRELQPGATGFVGGTWGLGSGGMGICVAQFESETAAKANSDRPEQGEWWAAIEPAFAEVTFRDTTDVDVIAQPHAAEAGFVQLIQGRVKDPEAARGFMQDAEDQLREGRPDVIGGLMAWHGVDGDFTQVMYFTSQEAARAGEQAMADDELGGAYQEMMATEPTFVDVFEPHVY